MSKNFVVNSNPYGAVTLENVLAFEKLNRFVLPDDYRHYLLHHNGGKFSRRDFVSKSEPDVDGDVHHMLGLHQGPEHARLQEGFRLSKYYDLDEFSMSLDRYFVFADTSTGSLLLLDLKTKGVSVFQPEDVEHESSEPLRHAIHALSDSFTHFVEDLVSHNETYSSADELEEFKKKVRQARLEAGWSINDGND
jgi:hypothetical protein